MLNGNSLYTSSKSFFYVLQRVRCVKSDKIFGFQGGEYKYMRLVSDHFYYEVSKTMFVVVAANKIFACEKNV